MDVDKLLNLERRSGVKNSEIDDFERKVTDVEAAIKGLVAGTLKPEDVHVEGIESEEEKAKKEKEREERRLILQEKERKLKEERKKEERERWWAGVEIFKPKQTDETTPTTISTPTDEEIDKKITILNRYTADYSRWNDWTPTDEVTLTEMKEIQQREEDEKNKEFEKNNSEFCNQFITDMNERKKKTEKKQESSDISRLKGNRYFKARAYEKALEFYMEALRDSPFDAKTVNNIAQVYIKTKDYDDALEFLSRTLYLEPSNIKALSRTALIHSERGDIQLAGAAIKQALLQEPENPDLLAQSRELIIIEKEKMAELKAIGKFGITQHNNDTSSCTAAISTSTTVATTDTATIVMKDNNTLIDNIFIQIKSLQSNIRSSSSTTTASSTDSLLNFDHNNLTALINAVLPLLLSDELLQIYARTSGMLEALLQLTVALCSVYTSTTSTANTTISSTLLACLQLLAHTIHNQRSAILLLLEYKLLPALKPIQLAAQSANLPLIHAISHIYYNSCLNNIASKVRTIILNDKEIIQNSIELVNSISYRINSENTAITTIEFNILILNTKLLHFIVFNEEKERNNSILVQLSNMVLLKFISCLTCALHMALYYTKQSSTATTATATSSVTTATTTAVLLSPSEYLELVIEVAVGSSQYEALRGLFAQKLPVSENPVNRSSYSASLCRILLNTLDTYSYLSINIIAILMNICLENTNIIKKEILSHQKGLDLATAQLKYTPKQRQDEDPMLLVRKAGLLARLVSEKPVQDYLFKVDNYKLLCQRILLTTADGEGDAQLNKCLYDECTHYIRILASLILPSAASAAEPYIRIGSECGVPGALLQVFPTPRRDGGEVTPTSVTLMPAELPPALLIGNAARCLMPYADHPTSATALYTDKNLLAVEKLICAMASCSDMRVRKNIAILLAKGCKIPTVREKITHFRGMQMMIELQKDL